MATNQLSATKAQILRAAAEALMQDEQIAAEIAGVETAAFVRNSRQIYKQNGFNFTDEDLRVIHDSIRRLCFRRGLHRRVLMPEDRMFQSVEASLRKKKSAPSGPRFTTTTPQRGRTEHN